MPQFEYDRWSPALGAEVIGANLDELSDERVNELYAALIEHQLLVFRNQNLAPRGHADFGRHLGDLGERHHSYVTLKDEPDVVVLDWHPDDVPDGNEWHSDMTYRGSPPFASILKAIIVPPVGGDTLWASMYSVHDSLDPGFRRDLEALEACHDPGNFRTDAYRRGGNRAIAEMMSVAGQAVWPMIARHPVTGRAYLNVSESFTRWIIGVGAAESQRTLSYLFDVINRPEHHVRLRWQPGTVAIWDNRATQHYAVADYRGHRRVMHRVAVATDRRLLGAVPVGQ